MIYIYTYILYVEQSDVFTGQQGWRSKIPANARKAIVSTAKSATIAVASVGKDTENAGELREVEFES
jgi:hypothetical protein